LATRRRSDPGKLASAARQRSETTLPIKWIAARVQIGTTKGAKSVLHHLAQSQDQRKTASALEPCAQLEFQSTVLTPFSPNAGINRNKKLATRRNEAESHGR
jgi:hypothetical protein